MTATLIHEFRYPDDYPQASRLWQGMEKGIKLGRSDEAIEIEKKLKHDPDLYVVAEAEGEVVGTILGGYDGRRGLIYHPAVSAPFRGRGVESRLMTEVLFRLLAKGCIRCYLHVITDNDEVVQYYEKHGWKQIDHFFTYGKDLD